MRAKSVFPVSSPDCGIASAYFTPSLKYAERLTVTEICISLRANGVEQSHLPSFRPTVLFLFPLWSLRQGLSFSPD